MQITDDCVWNRDTQSCKPPPSMTYWVNAAADLASGVFRWPGWRLGDNRGPCAKNYHIPTQDEYSVLYNAL